MPWVYTRRVIARSWRVPPWVVDEAPTDEVLTELRIINLESEAEQARRKK